MIQIKKQRPSAGDVQGRARGQDWWGNYRPTIQTALSYPQDVASYTIIAAMIRYPAESCSLIQSIKASDFTSDITKQMAKVCLFELRGYGCILVESVFNRLESQRWNQTALVIHMDEIYKIPFHADLEVVKEVIRGAVKELKHERVCTNRRFN